MRGSGPKSCISCLQHVVHSHKLQDLYGLVERRRLHEDHILSMRYQFHDRPVSGQLTHGHIQEQEE